MDTTTPLIPPSLAGSTKAQRHQFWQEVIQQQQTSKLTARAFCKQHCLKLGDFQRWRYRLNAIKRAHAVQASPPSPQVEQAESTPKFAKLVIANEPEVAKKLKPIEAPSIEMVVDTEQVRLQIPTDFHESTLNRLLKVVRRCYV